MASASKNTSHGNQLTVARGSILSQKEKETKKQAKQTNIGDKAQQRAVRDFIRHNKKGATRVFVAGGSRSGNHPMYEEEAFKLGQVIGEKNFRLDFGLSSKGIMGAVAKGVLQAWSQLDDPCDTPIQAVTTKEYLALYQSDNVIDQVSEIIVAHTLEERKKQLLGADFVIFAPGGVGTLDELVYDCVAMQDGFLNFKPFVLFNVDGFFYHLLEYLKEIQIKGFSDTVPFIVVDDSFEAGVAFDMIDSFYTKKIKDADTKESPLEIIEHLIYLLPYLIHQRLLHPTQSTTDILKTMSDIHKNGMPAEKDRLKIDIETAYLNKEIERMYERLAKAGRDTAQVSDKLNELKKRYQRDKFI